jgi:outer membrane protein insertion porin family
MNYESLNKLLNNLENSAYSLNSVNKILEEIDKITIEEEFKTINASIEEVVVDNKLNINFIIEETEKFLVEKINIYGNNITRESVIRNQLEIDEGDPYSDILAKKSENNIKSLNFFKEVQTQVVNGKDKNSKIINFQIQEKPTGEIMAGAGAGTEGGSIYFGVKENNYLGKGLSVDANATVSAETFKGKLSVTNPNYKNSDKKVFASIQAIEIDQLKNYGYKTNKSGFEIGTNFEYLRDFYLGLSSNTFVEKIETNSTASASQKNQAGNYLDTFVNLDFNLDKRNQKFKPSDGFYVNYDVNIPVVSDTNTLTNTYNYKMYKELYENNVSSFSLLLRSATSLSNNDIKLTERLSIPSSKLRGFERGKIGPKDGADFIGGNFLASINFQSNLPIFFQNSQNLDAIIFLDAANVWGVDYDSSIDDGSKIRSSIGIGVDWLTAVGPVTFSLSHPLSKKDSDIEETFRFNLGTTF